MFKGVRSQPHHERKTHVCMDRLQATSAESELRGSASALPSGNQNKRNPASRLLSATEAQRKEKLSVVLSELRERNLSMLRLPSEGQRLGLRSPHGRWGQRQYRRREKNRAGAARKVWVGP